MGELLAGVCPPVLERTGLNNHPARFTMGQSERLSSRLVVGREIEAQQQQNKEGDQLLPPLLLKARLGATD